METLAGRCFTPFAVARAGLAASLLLLAGCMEQAPIAAKPAAVSPAKLAAETPKTSTVAFAEPEAPPAKAEEPAEKPAPEPKEADQPKEAEPKEEEPKEGKPQAEPKENDPLKPANPFRRRLDIPEFPKKLEWLNSKPLSKKDLKGKFVLLDFWTYCCINCMHILPELKKLEKQYPNELVVIGVHSAKFDTEKDTDNILGAMLRYEIVHPVVNDAEHAIWDTYGISSWPTMLLIDPEGKAVYGRSGEFKATEIAEILDLAIPYYRGEKLLDEKPFTFDLAADKQQKTPLRFPGKVLADEAGGRLFISDSNHNRIVITTLEGKLLETIGSGAIGAADGDYKTASFDHPQGCALLGETLYVADTENHLLRKIDLKAKTVATIAGMGMQAKHAWPGLDEAELGGELPKRFVGKPLATAINSPWDLWIHDKDLYIAMAGPHQIWKMPLDESEIGPYAGNGREDIVDGPLLPTQPYEQGFSSFAQPSGLTSDGEWLYVADSEGSSVRAVPFDSTKEVRTLVGTAELPFARLFTFGDIDGPKSKAKLQHCLGVVYVGGKLYVADTYNNKIRVIDVATGKTTTLAGKGFRKPGQDDAEGTFDEPAGIAHAAGKLYVADTNNHLIRTIDLESRKVGTLTIAGLAPPNPPKVDKKPSFKGAHQEKQPLAQVKADGGNLTLEVAIKLPAGWKINPSAPMSYWLDSPQATGPADRASFGKKNIDKPVAEFTVVVPVKEAGEEELALSLNYYYCQESDEGICKFGSVVFTLPLKLSPDGDGQPIKLVHEVPDK